MNISDQATRIISATKQARNRAHAELTATEAALVRDQRQAQVELGEIELRKDLERIETATTVTLPKLKCEIAALDGLASLADARLALLQARGRVASAQGTIAFLEREATGLQSRAALACELDTNQRRFEEARVSLAAAENATATATSAYCTQLKAAREAGAFGIEAPVAQLAAELDARIESTPG